MNKFLLYAICFLFSIFIIFVCARIYYSYTLDKASTSWKLGHIADAIDYYERIPKFIYPVANENLFRIYINPDNEMHNVYKAYSYIESYQCNDKKQLIDMSLKTYTLSPNDNSYLEKQIHNCNS